MDFKLTKKDLINKHKKILKDYGVLKYKIEKVKKNRAITEFYYNKYVSKILYSDYNNNNIYDLTEYDCVFFDTFTILGNSVDIIEKDSARKREKRDKELFQYREFIENGLMSLSQAKEFTGATGPELDFLAYGWGGYHG